MSQTNHLLIGGLVAMGFDPSGKYLLTVSHSGRGVFATNTWRRIGRDATVEYPRNGKVLGIGPLTGQLITVVQRSETTPEIFLSSPDGKYRLWGESDGITVKLTGEVT